MAVNEVYWVGKVPLTDDFGNTIITEFVDGKMVHPKFKGQWAILTPTAYAVLGSGFGTGLGQRYRQQADGRWLKVEG